MCVTMFLWLLNTHGRLVMDDSFWERLAKRAPRSQQEDDSRLNREIGKSLTKIRKSKPKNKHIRSARGGLSSMGARGVFLKEEDIYSRRVVVKASYIKSSNEKHRSRIRHHLNYVGRETTPEEEKSLRLYSQTEEHVDINLKISDFEKAPHFFSVIISPEDGDKLDLKKFTREFVHTIETDLRTKLDWVAGNHFDTNEPHVHVLINGLDDRGKRLLMKRDYVSHGLRVRASQTVNKELGLRNINDIISTLKIDINSSRKSVLDVIINKNKKSGKFNLAAVSSESLNDIPKYLLEDRLRFLENKQLAVRVNNHEWQLKDTFIDELKSLERSTSIIEKLSTGWKIGQHNCEIISSANIDERTIKGHVVERGYVDDMGDKEYLVVKSKEKSFSYVELEKYSEKSPARVGEFIRVDTTKPFLGAKKSDSTILEVAQGHGGIYDAKMHALLVEKEARLPPGVTAAEYAQVHVKRLEVLRRIGLVKEIGEGRFAIPKDYLARLNDEAEKSKLGHKPHIKITRLSPSKLAQGTLRPRLTP